MCPRKIARERRDDEKLDGSPVRHDGTLPAARTPSAQGPEWNRPPVTVRFSIRHDQYTKIVERTEADIHRIERNRHDTGRCLSR